MKKTKNHAKMNFKDFCHYVDDHIFSPDYVGTYVPFIVDQAFVSDFCKSYAVSALELTQSFSSAFWAYPYHRDELWVKGITAVQLYAASKRANDEHVSATNYRDRLAEVLNWEMNDVVYWMKNYQEEVWLKLYKWCDFHDFQLTKCSPMYGPGRYVQYPVNQALRVFTEEDLKYIAHCFVEKNLSPNEDLQKCDFEGIVTPSDIRLEISVSDVNHGKLVIEESFLEEDYYNQVYNFFLRWNGEYKVRNSRTGVQRIGQNGIEQNYLYMTTDLSCFETRDAYLSKITEIPTETVTYEALSQCYHFKRFGVILFKHDDIYNDWQETRFLEDLQEEGIVVCFLRKEYMIPVRLHEFLIAQKGHLQFFRIRYGSRTKEFYSKGKRPYEFFGGLKIGRNAYLQGAAPVLRLDHEINTWIDGELIEKGKIVIPLDYLKEGVHYIHILGYPKMELEIVDSSVERTGQWNEDYNQWHFNRDEAQWESRKEINGIVGLDFSVIPQHRTGMDISTLKRWSNMLTFGKSHENETNISLQIIKNTEL